MEYFNGKKDIFVKGHGSLRKLRTGAVVSVLSSSVFFGGVVSADEVSSSSVSPTVVASSVTESRISEGQVSSARAEAEAASQAVVAQEVKLAEIQSTISSQESVIADLGSQVAEVEKVTPRVVEGARADADSMASALADAEARVGYVESSLTDASAKVTNQEGVVADAEANAGKTASAVADAQAKVDALSSETNTTELEENISNLSDAVEKDKTALVDARTALDSAKLAESNKGEAIKNQERVVDSKAEKANAADVELIKATSSKTKADTALAGAKSELDTAKAGTTKTETIQVGTKTETVGGQATLKPGVAVSSWYETNGIITNDAYLKAIKALADGSGSVEGVKEAIRLGVYGMLDNKLDDLNNVAALSSGAFNAWKNNIKLEFSDTDKSTLVDVRNLSEAQRTDLSLFYASLVNELRARVGTDPLVVTQGSVSRADQTVQSIFNGMWSHYKGMDSEQLVSNGFWNTMQGLNTDTGQTGQPSLKGAGHSLDSVVMSTRPDIKLLGWKAANIVQYSNNDGRKQTMADLKSNIVATLGVQLYGIFGDGSMGEGSGGIGGRRGNDFESALAILGLRGNSFNSVGLDFDHVNIYNGMVDRAPDTFVIFSNSSDSLISNPYSVVSGGSTITTPIYESTTTTVVDDALVAKAQDKYDLALGKSQKANSVYDQAKSAYDEAQAAYKEAQAQLDALRDGSVDISALEQSVLDAETQLAKDEASLQSARETLALAKASAVDKAKALAEARANLVESMSANESARGVLSREKETLEVLVKSREVAQLAKDDAIAKLSQAQGESSEARDKYAKLSDALVNKGSILAELNTKIGEARSALEVARVEYKGAKELLDKLKGTASEKLARYDELARLKVEQGRADAELKRLEELKAKVDAISSSGGIASPVIDSTGRVVDYVDGSKVVANAVTLIKTEKRDRVTQVADKMTDSQVEKALPATGTETENLALSTLAAGSLGLLGTLALVQSRRKKR